ncbi:MAG TPA: FTR1 family protein [Opitutaceae bacterium]|nr:FTR1 family protein [Lacunisphaera sp.]HWA09156.1 FTR1 family protein [Opitutaceae bacterium]
MSHTASLNYRPIILRTILGAAALVVLGVLVWQGIAAAGNPNPLTIDAKASPTVAILDIGVLVFREGLECILVLSAITASMVGANRSHRRPVAAGAGIGLFATLITWFVVVGIVTDLTENYSALNVQAATGLLAVIVLLVVMNWFFHKMYWGGWIGLHNKRKRTLLKDAESKDSSRSRLVWGLGLLGFSSLYREGFEVVLFLQSYMLKLGGSVVLQGVLWGLLLTGIVAVLTFIAHQKLPYRRMLVLTGVLLGVVLLVMVGEEAQEMQLAHWLPTTQIGSLANVIPGWMGLWFSVFPTAETLAAQAIAAAIVLGSYWLAKGPAAQQKCEAECATDSEAISGQSEQCDPFCVSATICRPSRELKRRE